MIRKNTLLLAFSALALSVSAQMTIPNAGFENWGNVAPGVAGEPTDWYSNKSGSSTATLGDPTVFKELTDPHSGNACVRIETISYLFGIKINGSLTTGVINAPGTDKAKGYVGTIKYGNAADIRRTPFTGRPDSLVGYYKYTQGGAAEQAKVTAILHTDHYNDPEVPVAGNTYPNTSANRIGRAIFTSPAANASTWTRFAVAFDYASGATPEYVMITMTSSADQMTNVAGSKLWLDDLEFIYNPAAPGVCDAPSNLVITQTTTAVNLSWNAAATVPAAGYGYAIISADSAQSPTVFYPTTDTFKNGITMTTSQFSELFEVGRTYNAYIVANCGPLPADPQLALISDIVMVPFVFGTGLGVDEAKAKEFQVYAYNNEFHVDLTEFADNNAVLTILDITGKEVIKVKLKGNQKNTISIPSTIQHGAYFYNVLGNGIQKTGKIAL